MMFSVPQFIDVEDKVAGPLTWRQLLWMIGMGAVLLFFYTLFDLELFFIAAVPTVLLFIAFAFYKPGGISMSQFIFHGILFLFRPKVSVWERPVRPIPLLKETPSDTAAAENEAEKNKKKVSQDKLKELAAILDRRDKAKHTV